MVGRRVAEFTAGASLDVQTSLALAAKQRAEQRAAAWLERSGSGPNVYEIRDAMGETMMGKVGIFRHGDELEQAVNEIAALLADCDRAVLRSKVPGMNPELSFALRLKGMLRLAYVTARGALLRTESRGAHYRSDHPLRNDAEWLNRTLVRWAEDAPEPEFTYEPVGEIDLPPGHRGYGSDERIEMKTPIEDYNAGVYERQAEHGRQLTREAPGSRMRRGDWKEYV